MKEPSLSGEVNLLRGEVTYFNRRFELFSGRIFNIPPGINPILEAQAEVSVGATKIYLLLEGPLRKPTLQLTQQQNLQRRRQLEHANWPQQRLRTTRLQMSLTMMTSLTTEQSRNGLRGLRN